MSKLYTLAYSGKFLNEFYEGLKSSQEDKEENFNDKLNLLKQPDQSTQKSEEDESKSSKLQELVKYNNPADAARDIVKYLPNLKAGHCWDWVEKVYNASGFDRKGVYQDLNYEGKDAGEHRAGPNLLGQLQPGDWLFINNKNTSDLHGNHSVIFLGWKGPNVAEVASYYDNAGHVHTYDINKYPVTAISKPTPKSALPDEKSKTIINALSQAKIGNSQVAESMIKDIKSSNKINNLLKIASYFEEILKK